MPQPVAPTLPVRGVARTVLPSARRDRIPAPEVQHRLLVASPLRGRVEQQIARDLIEDGGGEGKGKGVSLSVAVASMHEMSTRRMCASRRCRRWGAFASWAEEESGLVYLIFLSLLDGARSDGALMRHRPLHLAAAPAAHVYPLAAR